MPCRDTCVTNQEWPIKKYWSKSLSCCWWIVTWLIHLIDARWKTWLIDEATKRGHSASQLAGLHVHFFLATAEKAARGDFGVFITAAEWLDVNYGSLVREVFVGELGGKRIVVIEPTAVPFPDAASTAAITYFQIGAKPKRIKLER